MCGGVDLCKTTSKTLFVRSECSSHFFTESLAAPGAFAGTAAGRYDVAAEPIA